MNPYVIFAAASAVYIGCVAHVVEKEKLTVVAQPQVQNTPYIEHKESVNAQYKTKRCKHDRQCWKMAEAIVWEARGESILGQVGVAYVIKNRVEDSRWPDDVFGVVRQKAQFSYVRDWHKQTPPSDRDWNKALSVAYDVLNENIEDITNGATHYHTKTVAPKWKDGVEYVLTVDNHHFYR